MTITPGRIRVEDDPGFGGVLAGTGSIGRRLADRALALASTVSPRAARFSGGRLARQQRLGEADALLERALRAFPRHPPLLARHALVAQQDGRFAEAAARWEALAVLRPSDALARCGLATCRRCLGDANGATAAIAEALDLRPSDERILIEAARTHDVAGRPEAAFDLWARLVDMRRNDPACRQGYADSLIRLGRLEAAEAEITAGLRRHPGHQGLMAARGLLAMRREDWDAAQALWLSYTAAFPEDATGHIYLARVTTVRQLANESENVATQLLAPVHVDRVEDDALRELMLRFEGIGADCEFGTVQRRFGAEPLGLLRWNDVTFATLAAALEARFAGMGNPATTELVTGGHGELDVRDRRWNLGMHTFLFAHEVSLEAIYPKMCRRVAYLRDKFVADLERGEKIFLYKGDDLGFAELQRLHALLRAYGPVRLLHVRRAAWAGVPPWPEGSAGTMATLAPDLHVGFVDRMGDLSDVAYDDWVSVCRAVVELTAREPEPHDSAMAEPVRS